MNELDLKLYELLVGRRTRFEPDGGGFDFVEVPDKPTIADLHKWLEYNYNNDYCSWEQSPTSIRYYYCDELRAVHKSEWNSIPYDSSKSLLFQSEETKNAIIQLIESNS